MPNQHFGILPVLGDFHLWDLVQDFLFYFFSFLFFSFCQMLPYIAATVLGYFPYYSPFILVIVIFVISSYVIPEYTYFSSHWCFLYCNCLASYFSVTLPCVCFKYLTTVSVKFFAFPEPTVTLCLSWDCCFISSFNSDICSLLCNCYFVLLTLHSFTVLISLFSWSSSKIDIPEIILYLSRCLISTFVYYLIFFQVYFILWRNFAAYI